MRIFFDITPRVSLAGTTAEHRDKQKRTCLFHFVCMDKSLLLLIIAYNFKVSLSPSLGQYLIPVSVKAMRIVSMIDAFVGTRCRVVVQLVGGCAGPFKSICRHARVRATRGPSHFQPSADNSRPERERERENDTR